MEQAGGGEKSKADSCKHSISVLMRSWAKAVLRDLKVFSHSFTFYSIISGFSKGESSVVDEQ